MPDQPKALRLHIEAKAELDDSVSFYRQRGGERLADRFKQHVLEAYNAIINTPERFAPVPDVPGLQKFTSNTSPSPSFTSTGRSTSGSWR